VHDRETAARIDLKGTLCGLTRQGAPQEFCHGSAQALVTVARQHLRRTMHIVR